MHDNIVNMSRFQARGWDLERYDDLSSWAVELSNIKSAVLEKHRSTLVRLSESIQRLKRGVEDEAENEEENEEEEAVPEPPKRGKGKPAVDLLPIGLNEPPVRDAIYDFLIAC